MQGPVEYNTRLRQSRGMDRCSQSGRPLALFLSVLVGALLWSAASSAACPAVFGDLDGDGDPSVADVQCSILLAFWSAGTSGDQVPDCLAGPSEPSAIDCDSTYDVIDIQLTISAAIELPLGLGVDVNGNGCVDACEDGPICGDGELEGSEVCDDGALNSDVTSDACRSDCTLPACGDGVVDSGEGCDDGAGNNDLLPDACRTSCVVATCGDSVMDTAEECDDGNDNSDTAADACRTTCILPQCGDGALDSGEACDDGAGNSDAAADACRIGCVLPSCGDSVVDSGEECDDANDDDSDGCSAACESSGPKTHDLTVFNQGFAPNEITIAVGDTVTWLNTSGFHTVTSGTAASGGDGIFDSGFISKGFAFSFTFLEPGVYPYHCIFHPSTMEGTITVVAEETEDPVCGNSQQEDGEECDDGNTTPGDGCSALCTTEPFCGDGQVDPGEECDDGNAGSGDGCSAGCVVEIPSGPATYVVDVYNYGYTPSTLTIHPGDTVTWKIVEGFHTATSGASPSVDGLFDSNFLTVVGAEFSYTFDDVGEFPYFCTIHPGSMTGTVTVEAP